LELDLLNLFGIRFHGIRFHLNPYTNLYHYPPPYFRE